MVIFWRKEKSDLLPEMFLGIKFLSFATSYIKLFSYDQFQVLVNRDFAICLELDTQFSHFYMEINQ